MGLWKSLVFNHIWPIRAVRLTVKLKPIRRTYSNAFIKDIPEARPVESSLKEHILANLSCPIKEILTLPIGSKVKAMGWIRSIRHHKNVSFVMLYDGLCSGELQLITSPNIGRSLEIGCSVSCDGLLQNSIGSSQVVELAVENLKILGNCPNTHYPLQKQEVSAEYLRAYPHLRSRTSRYGALMRLRSELLKALRSFLDQNRFFELQAPSIVFSDCEGGGETFKLDKEVSKRMFGKDAHLTVSAQLHAEIGATSLGRVYTLGPIFRAEKHDTLRHLSEFSMLEVEIAFVDSLAQLTQFVEKMLRYSLSSLMISELAQIFPGIAERILTLVQKPIPIITYTDAVKVIQKASTLSISLFVSKLEWGESLKLEHEKYLSEIYFKGPVFVTDFPTSTKAFYMKSNNVINNRKDWLDSTSTAFDLLIPQVAEIIGGSLREDQVDNLERAMSYHCLNANDYEWYLDLRRYGSVPHGGFGLGFDRLIQYLTATSNIRDVVLVPRVMGQTPMC